MRSLARLLLLLSVAGNSVYPQSPAQSSLPASPNPETSIAEIAASYTNFPRITKSEVFVNPELAMLCRGASQAEVEAARVRHGPHANTGIYVYMNKLAADAFATNSVPFPVGSVVVKQKSIHGYMDKNGRRIPGGGTGVGGMVKRTAGYDPKHGDWEYFYFENVGKIEIESGRISSCVQCHKSAKEKDYVFGTWRETNAKGR